MIVGGKGFVPPPLIESDFFDKCKKGGANENIWQKSIVYLFVLKYVCNIAQAEKHV